VGQSAAATPSLANVVQLQQRLASAAVIVLRQRGADRSALVSGPSVQMERSKLIFEPSTPDQRHKSSIRSEWTESLSQWIAPLADVRELSSIHDRFLISMRSLT
jgi:hypothetical protein